jgi:hypothetical protein
VSATIEQQAALRELLECIRRVKGEDLNTVTEWAASVYSEELFALGLSIFNANPKRLAEGPPPGAVVHKEMRVVGIQSGDYAKIRAMRCLRERSPGVSLTDAHKLMNEIVAGKPLVYGPSEGFRIEIEAAAWRRAGWVVEVNAAGDVPSQHEETFQAVVCPPCTG